MIQAATMKEKKTEGEKVEQTGTDQLRVNKHAGKLSGGDDDSKTTESMFLSPRVNKAFIVKCKQLSEDTRIQVFNVKTGNRFLLEQLVVCEAEGFLQQDRQHHAKDEEAFLLRCTFLITDLNRDKPHQRGQQQRHQPEKCSAGGKQQI